MLRKTKQKQCEEFCDGKNYRNKFCAAINKEFVYFMWIVSFKIESVKYFDMTKITQINIISQLLMHCLILCAMFTMILQKF